MAEPLTTAELKAHLRKTTTDEDTLIATYGVAAREWCEEYTGHILNQREVTDSFTAWGDYLALRYRPITVGDPTPALTVTFTNEFGGETEYEDRVIRDQIYPWKIAPPYGFPFPTLGENGAIQVTYTAGYASAAAVPELFKIAIKLLVTSMYINRGAMDDDTKEAVRFMLRSKRGAVLA
jgi:uncharacterized phiE125 gp8 family phage protein